jgi:PAS domain-containing protein
MIARTPSPGGDCPDGSAAPGAAPATCFAEPQRSSLDAFQQELALIRTSPVIAGLMQAMSGLLAVLNEHRQILAVNPSLLQALGIADADVLLGLRLGEAVGCVHADDGPGGCATGPYCSNCGAAIAQVVSLAENRVAEGVCAIETTHPEPRKSIFFRIRACPVVCGPRRILLLFLQDESQHQQAAALERVFFHDFGNTVTGILGLSEFLAHELDGGTAALAQDIFRQAQRLARELELQRCLAQSSSPGFKPVVASVALAPFVDELVRQCQHHPAARGRNLWLGPAAPGTTLATDPALLLRVVYNMVLNALEATEAGGEVRLCVEADKRGVRFRVWNRGEIPAAVGRRIFQRNFSTKGALGRGLGTYSMKLLGEQLLGGRVSFSTSAAEGTWFELELPAASVASPGPPT